MSGKRLILLGFIVIILVAIPLTVYVVQKQQQTKSKAAPSTNLSFVPPAQSTSVGQTVSFDIKMNPGNNQVSFVKLIIDYDATKLTAKDGSLVPTPGLFASILQGPTYGPGTISVTLSVGTDPTKAIQTPATIGTVSFQTIAPTDPNAPSKISFDSQTEVLSIASSDQFNENVLSTTNPALVTITGSASPTPTPTSSVSVTPTPTSPQGTSANQNPVCTGLALDNSATGTAPYSLTFTTSGNDPDGTISKATFNFGDGSVQDVTQGGGIGTNSVSVALSHTYSTPGTFTATAILTDNNGALSNPSTCTQTITVNSAIGGVSTTPSSSSPTLAPTGPGNKIVGMGIAGIVLSLIGSLLFFVL